MRKSILSSILWMRRFWILALLGCLAGCPRESAPSAEQAANKRDIASPRVQPGTLLAEDEFQAVLRQTGAPWIVVQVFMEACGPCMTEALHLAKKRAEWQQEGVAILGLGIDETPSGPKNFHENTGGRINFPLYLAPWFAEQQQISATPTLLIFSSDGQLQFRTDTLSEEQDLLAEVDEALRRLRQKF